jgi:hypothetical protein
MEDVTTHPTSAISPCWKSSLLNEVAAIGELIVGPRIIRATIFESDKSSAVAPTSGASLNYNFASISFAPVRYPRKGANAFA